MKHIKPAICPRCGDRFMPKRRLSGRISKVCPSCVVLALAELAEAVGSEGTIRDIHDGEQMGAMLRSMARFKP